MNVGLVGGGNISGTHARAAVAAGLRIAGTRVQASGRFLVACEVTGGMTS